MNEMSVVRLHFVVPYSGARRAESGIGSSDVTAKEGAAVAFAAQYGH